MSNRATLIICASTNTIRTNMYNRENLIYLACAHSRMLLVFLIPIIMSNREPKSREKIKPCLILFSLV